MRLKYSVISIIYNPNSTGKSHAKAERLRRDLKSALPDAKIRLRATKYQGHAESLAHRTALLSRHALIVSVSGDGGYNEVVNGAMRAVKLGRRVTVGLIPAGNANDHYASRHRGDFVERVAAGDDDEVDIIRLRTGRLTRYGHSYAGVGITPQASEMLNVRRLNLWQEVKIIATVVTHLKAAKLLVDGEVHRYNSLIFSNVGRMAKVVRIPGHKIKDDGMLDVSAIYHRNPIRLIADLTHAALFGLPESKPVERFDFETLRQTPVQIDGEVTKLPAGAKVTVDIVPHTLRSIV